MKTCSLFGALLLVCGSLNAAVKTQSTTVYFASDSANISEQTAQIIETFINELTLSGDYEFQIIGHTDQEGDFGYNDELSAKRAFAIRELLIAKGVEESTCVVETFGKRRLLFKSNDMNSMAKNRRVDIVFKGFYFDSLDDVHAELSRSSKNSFVVSPNSNQVLKCSDGTLVSFDSESFITLDGNLVTEPVQVDVIEAISYADMLANKLSTWSDDRVLKTGGMANISVRSLTGDSLILAEGKALNVALPLKGTPEDDMQLFLSTNGQNWTATGNLPLSQSTSNESDKPAFYYSSIIFPEFEIDQSLAPVRPLEPSYPRSPTRPRAEGYFMPIKWYQFLSRKKIEKRNNNRYQYALSIYGEKLEHFDYALSRYEERCENYPKYLEEYYQDLAEWNLMVDAMRTEFYERRLPELKRFAMLKYSGEYEQYEKELAEWKEKRQEEILAYQNTIKEMGVPQGQSMNYYLFQNASLGWINCDKFYDIPEEQKVDIVAEVEGGNKAEVILIYPNNKVMLSFYKSTDKHYRINQVPGHIEGEVLAYKVENGELLVGQHPFNGQKKMKIEYEPMKLSEFRSLIENININS